jgi:hypothetical protein
MSAAHADNVRRVGSGLMEIYLALSMERMEKWGGGQQVATPLHQGKERSLRPIDGEKTHIAIFIYPVAKSSGRSTKARGDS